MSNVSYPPASASRGVMVKVRLSATEKARLENLARARGRSMSELIRVALAAFSNADAEPVVTLAPEPQRHHAPLTDEQ